MNLKLLFTIHLMLLGLAAKSQEPVQPYDRSVWRFPYFDFQPLNCPCIGPNEGKKQLHPRQLQAYQAAQYSADSLSKLEAPCYYYRARFICGVHYLKPNPSRRDLSLLAYPSPVVARQVRFQKAHPRDSTICPAWQIVLLKLRRRNFLTQQSSGSVFCAEERP